MIHDYQKEVYAASEMPQLQNNTGNREGSKHFQIL
jgi:hypothetical protein